MGLPLVLTEADSHLGLANRMLARRAERVCLAFPIPGRDGGPYVVTGRPVPRAVLEADPSDARRRFGIPEPADCVTVVGGSLGALSINLAAFDAFTRFDARTTTSASPGSSTSSAAATTRSCVGAGTRRAGRSGTRCSSTSPTSGTSSPPRTSSSPGPAAR